MFWQVFNEGQIVTLTFYLLSVICIFGTPSSIYGYNIKAGRTDVFTNLSFYDAVSVSKLLILAIAEFDFSHG